MPCNPAIAKAAPIPQLVWHLLRTMVMHLVRNTTRHVVAGRAGNMVGKWSKTTGEEGLGPVTWVVRTMLPQ